MFPNIIGRSRAASKRTAPLLSLVRHKAAYEGEGKTTVRVLNQEQDLGLMIDAYGTYGFRLNNGITVLGPMAIFPRTVLSWQVPAAELVTPESLRLFKLLKPKIDLIIIGLDSKERSAVSAAFLAARSAGLNPEVLPTEHACSTFNFLNAEGRSVVAALIPPTTIEMNENDMLQSKLHYQNLYNRCQKNEISLIDASMNVEESTKPKTKDHVFKNKLKKLLVEKCYYEIDDFLNDTL